jgi:alkanesulfonate monooxygenase SsuD/methylene tetrahydromethanopterin reductase-like flavin-dependent oxidoreductase (luciferase family)
MRRAWSGEGFRHCGRFWNLNVPKLRPLPYTKPHPELIRAASSEASMIAIARRGQPVLMNVQTNETTRHRMATFRRALAEAECDETTIARLVGQCWIWRNVFVVEMDAESERIGVAAFVAMQQHRAAMRECVFREQGLRLDPLDAGPAARADPTHALIAGSPATVAEAIA